MQVAISEIAEAFPAARIAVVAVAGIGPAEAPAALRAEIAAREERCRARWAGTELSQIPGVAAWRAAYKGFGIKQTSYRSSVERLVKRVLAGDALPAIHPLVDIYNAVSLTHVFCCGADDRAKLTGPLAFRFSREGDSFLDMGVPDGEDPSSPPKPGEVVYADGATVLCRRWNWRQDLRTAIGAETRDAILTIQANGPGDLDAAIADFADLAARHCGASVTAKIAERANPVVEL